MKTYTANRTPWYVSTIPTEELNAIMDISTEPDLTMDALQEAYEAGIEYAKKGVNGNLKIAMASGLICGLTIYGIAMVPSLVTTIIKRKSKKEEEKQIII